jgi:hypothetical protein
MLRATIRAAKPYFTAFGLESWSLVQVTPHDTDPLKAML